MPMKMRDWFKPVAEFPPLAKTFDAVNRFVCGVVDCLDGVVTGSDDRYTYVECETHGTRTHWDTVEIVRGEQQVIRVQDTWRQHGTSPPPGKSK